MSEPKNSSSNPFAQTYNPFQRAANDVPDHRANKEDKEDKGGKKDK